MKILQYDYTKDICFDCFYSRDRSQVLPFCLCMLYQCRMLTLFRHTRFCMSYSQCFASRFFPSLGSGLVFGLITLSLRVLARISCFLSLAVGLECHVGAASATIAPYFVEGWSGRTVGDGAESAQPLGLLLRQAEHSISGRIFVCGSSLV